MSIFSDKAIELVEKIKIADVDAALTLVRDLRNLNKYDQATILSQRDRITVLEAELEYERRIVNAAIERRLG